MLTGQQIAEDDALQDIMMAFDESAGCDYDGVGVVDFSCQWNQRVLPCDECAQLERRVRTVLRRLIQSPR